MYVLPEYVIILDLPMEARVVHPDEHIVDAQKVTQQHKETGGHNALQIKTTKYIKCIVSNTVSNKLFSLR